MRKFAMDPLEIGDSNLIG